MMDQHLKGILITVLGALFIVPDSLFVRLIHTGPFEISFWRGVTSGGFIAIMVLAFQGPSGFKAIFKTGLPGMIYTVLIGYSGIGFVFAVALTSVANVVFILAAMPIFAAIFSRIFLSEPIRPRMIATMAVVLVGLSIIAYGTSSNEIATWEGNFWALSVAIAYAAALTAARKVKGTSLVPAIPFAFIGASLIIAPFADPTTVEINQWPLFIAHGAFFAVASGLMTLGPRYIGSDEVALLILLESVLAPLLVWAVIGENPGSYALTGGALVIGALLISNLVALKASKLASKSQQG
jgi:drug/metabolite transporter (DMT)-like permease